MSGAKARMVLLAIFLVIVLGVGFAIGLTIRPGEWYASLSKPAWTPPNWLFGPAWTAVYVLIAIAGWRVALMSGFRSSSFRLWIVQLLLNWLWTPVFFGLHQIAIGLIILLALLSVVIVFILRVPDRIAEWCFVPYAIWLCYATTLNMGILLLN